MPVGMAVWSRINWQRQFTTICATKSNSFLLCTLSLNCTLVSICCQLS